MLTAIFADESDSNERIKSYWRTVNSGEWMWKEENENKIKKTHRVSNSLDYYYYYYYCCCFSFS